MQVGENIYLYVNGELVDEHIKASAFTPIELEHKNEEHTYHVTLFLSNSITFKVAGKLIKK